MSDENKQLLPSSIVDLLIFDTFKRNGADMAEPAKTFSDEEKKMIRNLIADMQRQVDSFIAEQKKIEENFKKTKFDPANLEYVNDLRKKEAEKVMKEGLRTSSRRTEAKKTEAKEEAKSEEPRRSRRRHRERRN